MPLAMSSSRPAGRLALVIASESRVFLALWDRVRLPVGREIICVAPLARCPTFQEASPR